MAAGQSQRFYSGVGNFNWYYLSSPPQVLRGPRVGLERRGLIDMLPYYTNTRPVSIMVLGNPPHSQVYLSSVLISILPMLYRSLL
jgi:hypothetical protein